MKTRIEIDSSGLEDRSEGLSSDDILRRFINIGLRIGKEAGVCNFWGYDTEWMNFHDYTEDELDSIYHDAIIEQQTWSEHETPEYTDSISLVLYSIDALRGDMKAAILATSKIGIFSQDDFLGWEKEKISQSNSKSGKAKKGKLKWYTDALLIIINNLYPEKYTLKEIRRQFEFAEERAIEDLEMVLSENGLYGCILERKDSDLTIIYQGEEITFSDNQIKNLLKNYKDKIKNLF